LQTVTKQLSSFRHAKRGISTVIVVMLSLALLITVVGNLVLWSYQMNELDRQRIQENVTIKNVTWDKPGISFEIKNNGPDGVHIVAIWIIDPYGHKRYTADLFLNQGETGTYLLEEVELPKDYLLVKIVTERGNLAVYSPV
jgi:hypothetical protein